MKCLAVSAHPLENSLCSHLTSEVAEQKVSGFLKKIKSGFY